MTEQDKVSQATEEEAPQSVFEHLVELRRRLIWTVLVLGIFTAVAYQFAGDIYGFLVRPLAGSMGGESTQRLIFTSLTEGFFTWIKLSFYAALFVTMPFVLLQVWLFIAPGLYKQEKRAFAPFLIATPVLFYLGASTVYFGIMPLAWDFFLSFQTTGEQTTLPIQLEARISEYLSFIITLIFAFGLCFQLPVLLTLLGRVGIVRSQGLKSKRKFAIVIAFVVGAFLTPPDVISQIGLALPIMLLYELSIILVSRVERESKNTEKSVSEPS